MQAFPILSLAIWVPILFGAFLLRAGSDRHPRRTRLIALAGALAGLAAVVPLVAGFDKHSAAMQFVEHRDWLAAFGAGWRLGIDGASLWLVVLTAFTTLVIVVASWESVTVRVAQYLASFLILSGLMVGVFTAQDGLLFFIFFEATLIPLYLLIGTWGRENRVHAAVKFFFISFAGSLLLLMAMLYLYAKSHTFDVSVWRTLQLGFAPQLLVFLGFFAAFAVKVPMWPVHTWLRDVYSDGPTGAALMLGMLKLGGYGFLRFALPITPDASHFFAPAVIALSLFAIVYASLLALAQTDLGKLLAYSTVAHMGLVTLGLFLFNRIGVEGAIVQLVSYGFVAGAMLLCVSVLSDRTNTRAIAEYGGVANVMPRFATFALLFSMANVGLPGTSGFVGEFMIIMGAIRFNFWIGALAALTLILSASYTLWMLKRVVFGKVASPRIAQLVDLNRREIVVFASLALIVLMVGVDPKPFTDAIDPTVARLIDEAGQSKVPDAEGTTPARSSVVASVHG
ncbi:NADH:ubiquinone oxidoreductase subunit M [Burkholderia ubonensis]|uniref:NADH-quinone oxidoreductase subunit M n=1 Tax=Burkholderia ubonensis TaxID=101571 RepID=UPI00075C3A74|nr:NADH-quinone oxidoreductase subunit M [Burkholderia ubonensis]KVA70935.1 NADH:ubiquinone oxidoreductase subunit M [Burkholderia ubonensis]KVO56222.1 NADH:ubiquinone oxidoreductase subunit M [Burkholderia ubonensis]KVX32107.1 NADH:ubiquinone oxidoreductase subunit M [Burkholderia ubonensis]KWO60974.1 NADH:ubiquinone oxidoreductase subunit M [Burkholderia ubonensis]